MVWQNTKQKKKKRYEKEITHPMVFSLFDAVVQSNLFGGVKWIKEPLTPAANRLQARIMERNSEDLESQCLDEIMQISQHGKEDSHEEFKAPGSESLLAKRSSSDGPSRRPDGLFSLHNVLRQEGSPITVCEQTQAFISLELKYRIEEQFFDAVQMSVLDWGRTHPPGTLFLSLLGDGANFYFVKFDISGCQNSRPQLTWWCSPVFTIDPHNVQSLADFLEILVRCTKVPAVAPNLLPKSYMLSKAVAVKDFTISKWIFSNSNSLVAEFTRRNGDGDDCRVLKLDLEYSTTARQSNAGELQIYQALEEIEELKPFLPRRIPDQSLEGRPCPILSLQDEGVSLASLCMCSESRRILPEVKTQITQSLEAYHSSGYAFVDIHPGNIVVKMQPDGAITAKLIDLESVRPLGKSWNDNQDCGHCKANERCWRHTTPPSVGKYYYIQPDKPGEDNSTPNAQMDFDALERTLESLGLCAAPQPKKRRVAS